MHFRIVICAAVLFSQLSVMSQIKKVNAETNIQNVTIFAAGARVERSASVALSPGRTEISFQSLSNQLDPQSVQIKADANITLLSVQAEKDFVSARKIEQEEKDFLEHIETLQDKLNFDKKLLEVYKREEEMLTKNEAIGGDAGVKTTELKEALDLHRQRLTDVYQKQLEIQKRIESQQKDFATLRNQLQEKSRKKDSINYIITALVDNKETRNVNFQLLYNVKDAGWYTTYDVRVKDASQPLKVLMNANVFQRSGETWKNISVSLSTGNPTDNATPPQLQPWMLSYYDPNFSVGNRQSNSIISGRVTNQQGEPIAGATVVIKNSTAGTMTDVNGFFKIQNITGNLLNISAVGFVSKEVKATTGYISIILQESVNHLEEVVVVGYGTLKGRVAGVSVTSDRNSKKDKAEIQTVSVATEYQPTTTVYQIKDKYTLETDGKTTTIGIKELDIPSLYDYYTVPKIEPTAFLTAKIINWQDFDLQSGEASLYFEGTYLGKTYIDLNAVSDTLSMSIGKDNGIKISRKLIKEFSSKRFIGSNRTDSKSYEISIRNTKHTPVTITVHDQFPVSTNKEISVDDQKAPEAQVDKETGIITWTIMLQPGEEKKLTKSYSVKYPKDRKVVLE